jgi:hypothetical protein
MCISIQKKVHSSLSKCFGRWGAFVATYPCIIFWVSFSILAFLSSAIFNPNLLKDERLAWIPQNAPSLASMDLEKQLYITENTQGNILVIADL